MTVHAWLICRVLRRMAALPQIILILGSVLCSSNDAKAAVLDPTLLPRIQAATFEVVAEKPTVDPLTYEKPLPLELEPFQDRNDRYFSIGTAFSIGNNRYVTAAHVLSSSINSLWGLPALRGADGHVYAIDKIEKFSLRGDFVVFSLVAPPAAAALEVNAKPALNDVVYAVGNALGTGVVIRDGLYTSDTPEAQDGSWKWMRFSAATSPGNSGGPLLDKEGKIIGVVVMKSANENLNYALPIDQVLGAADHKAEIDLRETYRLELFDTIQTDTFKAQFALPLSVVEFNATFQKLENAFYDTQLRALLAKEPDKLFPQGVGSSRVLHTVPRMSSFPALVMRQSNGDWELSGKASNKVQLSANGYVVPGVVGHHFLFHLRKPDNVSASELYSSPDQLINQLAKIDLVDRPVGSEKIKVTAFGKPAEDSVYTDAWQRHWQVRVWALPFGNAALITLSLPVPDGYVTMMRVASAREKYQYLIDLKAMANFCYVAYEGTLAQWKDYLDNAKLLPAAFKDIKIDFEAEKRFSYASKRLSFSYTPELQNIGPDNVLTLGFGYFDSHGKVDWDVGNIRVKRNANDRDWIDIARHAAPSEDLDDTFKSKWGKILGKQHPYDAIASNEGDQAQILTSVGVPEGAAPSVLYTAFVGIAGITPQDAMKGKLDLLLKNLRVNEN